MRPGNGPDLMCGYIVMVCRAACAPVESSIRVCRIDHWLLLGHNHEPAARALALCLLCCITGDTAIHTVGMTVLEAWNLTGVPSTLALCMMGTVCHAQVIATYGAVCKQLRIAMR